jgi:hypothetical protein
MAARNYGVVGPEFWLRVILSAIMSMAEDSFGLSETISNGFLL